MGVGGRELNGIGMQVEVAGDDGKPFGYFKGRHKLDHFSSVGSTHKSPKNDINIQKRRGT